ncbi:MAG: hypothetical protein ABSG61_13250 [Gemmatimonadales bacterium]|jgi:hypothetical protein
MRRAALFLLMLVALAAAAAAQQPVLPPVDTSRVVELRLTDSTALRGRVVAEDLSALTLVTAAGARVSVPRASLLSWQDVTDVSAEGRRDPNDSRLFLAHTARAVPKGKFYFLDYLVFFPVASYGVTDQMSLTGGMSLVPFSPDQLFYVAPKFNLLQTPAASVAAGVLYLRIVGFIPASGYAGIGYGVATLGGPTSSATVLVGFPFASGGWERRPLVVLGGETRVSPTVKLMAEGWRIPGTDVVPAVGGLRLIGTHVSWDLGLLFLIGARTTQGGFLPWVDFTIHW